MSVPTLDRIEDGEWQRLSPRMLLVHPVVEIVRALPALIGVVLAGSTNGHGGWWGLIGAGVVAVLSLSRWFTTRLRVTAEQVQLRHGLLRRRSIATRRDRIRTVDVTAHLLHRLLGLARVVIGTGTSDRKDGGRLVLDGLTRAAADRLRDDLLHRSAPSAEPWPAQYDLARLDRRWIRFAPFTLSGVITGLVIWGFAWRVQGESGVDLTRVGPLRAVTRHLETMPHGTAVAVIAVAVLVFIAATSTIGYVLAFWDFRLRRHDGGTLEVTRGLITARATSIERRRLAGVEISEPLILRAVGGARTLAVATGLRVGRGAERGGEVLLPPAPRAEAERVAALALDGSPAVTIALRRHPPTAHRRRVVRAVLPAALVLAASIAGPAWAPYAAGALVLAAVPIGFDRAANLGHAVADGQFVARSGSLVRRRVVLADDAVIGWNLRTSWFQRRAGLTTLTATTAAGRQGYAVLDVEPGEALAVADVVTPGLLDPWRRP